MTVLFLAIWLLQDSWEWGHHLEESEVEWRSHYRNTTGDDGAVKEKMTEHWNEYAMLYTWHIQS